MQDYEAQHYEAPGSVPHEPEHALQAHEELALAERPHAEVAHAEPAHAELDPTEAAHADVAPAEPHEAELAAAQPTSNLNVIGRYDSDGTSYVMYSDGSIEAQSEAGVYRFGSMAELKAFIEG